LCEKKTFGFVYVVYEVQLRYQIVMFVSLLCCEFYITRSCHEQFLFIRMWTVGWVGWLRFTASRIFLAL